MYLAVAILLQTILSGYLNGRSLSMSVQVRFSSTMDSTYQGVLYLKVPGVSIFRVGNFLYLE